MDWMCVTRTEDPVVSLMSPTENTIVLLLFTHTCCERGRERSAGFLACASSCILYKQLLPTRRGTTGQSVACEVLLILRLFCSNIVPSTIDRPT